MWRIECFLMKEKAKEALFAGKILLITGGTGSFGHAAVDRFLQTDIKEIRILSRDEHKQSAMREAYGDKRLRFFIGDIRDYESIEPAFKGVDYVFHAAALKQVPSCEAYPMEAVKTNVIGSNNVISASVAHKVRKAVFLSTDKAAYPTSAMGMSKALMEKAVIAKARQIANDGPVLCLTRYGNIMGSRGSVIPLFLKQISAKKPITITNPEMTRFMMRIDDAVDLVLDAFLHGEQGDLFVRKAPAVSIWTLAKAILELTNPDVGIKFIGPRQGEKLFETLITHEEMPRAIDEGSFFRIPADQKEGIDTLQPSTVSFDSYTSHGGKLLDIEETKALLASLPTFKAMVAGSDTLMVSASE